MQDILHRPICDILLAGSCTWRCKPSLGASLTAFAVFEKQLEVILALQIRILDASLLELGKKGK